jgi:hypothetical protein
MRCWSSRGCSVCRRRPDIQLFAVMASIENANTSMQSCLNSWPVSASLTCWMILTRSSEGGLQSGYLARAATKASMIHRVCPRQRSARLHTLALRRTAVRRSRASPNSLTIFCSFSIDPQPPKRRVFGSQPLYSVQFSRLRSWTRPNSPVLLVTSVSSRARACAAMKRSFAPIIVPRTLSTARICA